ncbi:MAG: hypothetical protein H0T39_03115, partial [Actinobacteria bacterium]|nr:hypothetical protein [Actinomycetota bacterium]
MAGAIERESQPPLVPRELDSLAHFQGTLLQLQPEPRLEAVRRIRAAGGERVSHALRLWHLPSARARAILPALAMSGALQDFEPDCPVAAAEEPLSGDPLAAGQVWLRQVGGDRLEPPGPGVAVTLIDSGLDVEHPEFAGRPDTELLNP